MKRSSYTFGVVLLLIVSIACDSQERQLLNEAGARLNEEPLFAYADEHLSDESLAAAVPGDFEFTEVKRSGFDRHGKPWITVGVRMEGPVPFARAIFYVHPDEAEAHEMFVEQADDSGPLDKVARGKDPQAAPWSQEELDVENRCSVRGDRLFWCHAHKGQVYLLVQSSAGGPTGNRKVTREERTAAMTLLTAFGRYLQEEIPEE